MPKRRPPAPSPRDLTLTPAHPPVSRPELLALAAILLLAAALRFAYPGRIAIEHYDEGVYASNIFFGPESDHRYPFRHLYAPPLLPWLIEWGVVFLGPESIAPFLPALILGTATVPLAWWSARCWFGPAAGLAAALLLATSDVHILYSRTALTDAPVTFFLLLAVYLYWEAVRRGSLRWSAAAGLATAAAWWTKYTGWLPLAIAAAGSTAWLVFDRQAAGASPRVPLKRTLACLAVATAIALAAWSPVLLDLQPHGGYAAVAANHRGYLLDDLTEWLDNAWEQGGHLAANTGWLTPLGLTLLVAAAGLRSRFGRGAGITIALITGLLTAWATFVSGPAFPLALLATAGLTLELLCSLHPAPDAATEDPSSALRPADRRLAAWLLAAWFVGLSLTTPLYRPYPRLALPWLMAASLGAATWLSGKRFRPPEAEGAQPLGFSLRTIRALLKPTPYEGWALGPLGRAELLALALLPLPACVWVATHDRIAFRELGAWHTARWSMPAWQDRTGLARAARQLADEFRKARKPGRPAILYVYAEPAAFYHLAARLDDETTAVLPAGNLGFLRHPPAEAAVYAVIGPHADDRIPPPRLPLAFAAYAPSTLLLGDSGDRPRPGSERLPQYLECYPVSP